MDKENTSDVAVKFNWLKALIGIFTAIVYVSLWALLIGIGAIILKFFGPFVLISVMAVIALTLVGLIAGFDERE
jgi:xanthine/uracil permease